MWMCIAVNIYVCVQLCERPVKIAGGYCQKARRGTPWGRLQRSLLPRLTYSCTLADIRSTQVFSPLLRLRSLPPPLSPVREGPGNAPTPRPRAEHSGPAGWNALERPYPLLTHLLHKHMDSKVKNIRSQSVLFLEMRIALHQRENYLAH